MNLSIRRFGEARSFEEELGVSRDRAGERRGRTASCREDVELDDGEARPLIAKRVCDTYRRER